MASRLFNASSKNVKRIVPLSARGREFQVTLKKECYAECFSHVQLVSSGVKLLLYYFAFISGYL